MGTRSDDFGRPGGAKATKVTTTLTLFTKTLEKALILWYSYFGGNETDEIIPLYGVGPTVEEAMDDYRSALVEYYETLEEDADRLAKHLREQLELLRHVFALSEEH